MWLLVVHDRGRSLRSKRRNVRARQHWRAAAITTWLAAAMGLSGCRQQLITQLSPGLRSEELVTALVPRGAGWTCGTMATSVARLGTSTRPDDLVCTGALVDTVYILVVRDRRNVTVDHREWPVTDSHTLRQGDALKEHLSRRFGSGLACHRRPNATRWAVPGEPVVTFEIRRADAGTGSSTFLLDRLPPGAGC